MARLREDLNKIHDRLNSIDVTMASQHVTLKEHIRRTELLETEIGPIKEHVTLVQAIIKVITVIGAAIGLAATIKALLG